MEQGMTVYNTIVIITLIAILLNLINNLRLLTPLSVEKANFKNFPLVSVLVPARNESKNIEKCVLSLVNQDYPNFELILLDDNSEDNTYQILNRLKRKYPGIKILTGEILPEGWTGKNFACYTLSKQAKGEWFLFTDADTVHRRNSISSAVRSTLKRKAEFISVIPDIVIESIPEKIFTPLIHFALLSFLPLKIVNMTKYKRIVIAMGPFMLINADYYRKIGGHKSIKNEILDDFKLAQLVKKYGGKAILMDGKENVSVRFYEKFTSVWDGFSKNSFGAFENSPAILLPFLLSCLCLYFFPYLLFLYSLLNFQIALLPLIQILIISLHCYIIARRFEINAVLILLHPLSVILWELIVLNSMRLTFLSRSLNWKQRLYPLKK
jgi:chlorobactene glucosyltransferase